MAVTLIGIAGPSGSGKSELSRRLAAAEGAPIVSLDSYYKDLAHVPLSVREKTNFDDPASLDDVLILDHARRLASGERVEVPHYDFATHTRAPGIDVVEPGAVVIIEGLFTLFWNELRDLLTTKVYVDLEDETCFARRKERDVRERGRTPESVDRQYAETVRPMAEKFIWPTKRHADLIIRGDAVLAESVDTVLRRVKAPSTS
ncbi:MAG: uridine kinase [Acidobacteria bacterium]|nr:uridine kinase [Acidobacteriota bacterium]